MPIWSPTTTRSPIAGGRRIHAVIVQTLPPGSGSSQADGDYGEDWTASGPPWHVAIEPATPTPETRMAGTSHAAASHVVTGPYRADVTPRARLLVDGARAFNIVSQIDPQDRHREIVVWCREVIP